MKKSFVLLTLLSLPLHAQFDKYKSKSNFDGKKESITKLAEPSEGPDVFGRKEKELPKSDKKYVNLNPETAFGPEVITSFDFKDASLEDLTAHMQKMTGLNLILDKDLKD